MTKVCPNCKSETVDTKDSFNIKFCEKCNLLVYQITILTTPIDHIIRLENIDVHKIDEEIK